MTVSSQRLTEARRQDSQRRREKVLAAIDLLASISTEITVSAVSRTAGVQRSLIYRHPDLHAAVIARAAERPTTPTAGPSVSQQSLLADVRQPHRIRRQDAHIRRLEQRLTEALGERVWRQSGLGDPPEYDNLENRINHVEQENADLRRQIADRDDDLTAARAANRQVISQSNRPNTAGVDRDYGCSDLRR